MPGCFLGRRAVLFCDPGKQPRPAAPGRPEFWRFVGPLARRGRRESRAQAAPVASRADEKSTRASPPQVQPVIPTFPAQWVYGLLRALPGERRLLSPLPRRHGPAGSTPRSRRRNHTTSPSAGRCSSRWINHPTPAGGHRIPRPTKRDDAHRPSKGARGESAYNGNQNSCKAKYLI